VSTRLKSIVFRLVIAASLWLGWSDGLAQNLLTNGGFELGLWDGVGGAMALGPGSTYIEEWQVVGGSSGGGIQWLTTNNFCGFMPADGLYFLNLVGTSAGADGAGVQLSLPLPVVPGQYYELTFDLGTTAADHWLYENPNGLPGPVVQVTINGTVSGSYFFFGDTSLPNTDGNNRWTLESTGAFEATGDWLSIIFSSIGYGGETFVGLDDVSVVPVPEPSVMKLLPAGALFLALFRRRLQRGVVECP
jgi:hypothetical protein